MSGFLQLKGLRTQGRLRRSHQDAVADFPSAAPLCSICLQACLPRLDCRVLLLQEENVRLSPEEGGTFLLHELSLSGLEDVQQARKQYKVTLQSCCAGCLRVTC